MKNLVIDRINLVGNGRHMRLRLRSGNHSINAIYFSATPETASIEPGDVVDVAFSPQINEFRGERSVQMNVLDLRPSCAAECSPSTAGYPSLIAGTIGAAEAGALLPDRNTLATVWRYLAGAGPTIREAPLCLCRKIVRWSGMPLSLGQLIVCLDIFRDVGLLQTRRMRKYMLIDLVPLAGKADLTASRTMQTLLRAKES